jgi:hypothetical protein
MSAVARRAAVLPTYALALVGAVPLATFVAVGLTAHHHRTRRIHR